MDAQRTEQSKYEAMWAHDAYRAVAPGEHHADRFLDLARPRPDHTVCDFGCGTGRGALRIRLLSGASVSAVDFTDNCLDPDIRLRLGEGFRFVRADLSDPLTERFSYGYCTDVLEHIPPQDVEKVLTNIGLAARKVYFAISTVPDVMGAMIGEPLHLTVRDPFWWHDTLKRVGYRIDWSQYNEGMVCFYASMYLSVDDFIDMSSINVEHETIKANIKANLSLGLREIVPHAAQDTTVYLLAGGPSLADFEQQIVEAGRAGTPIVTVNGTYKWLLDRGIKPAAQVMVDARTFNRRFVEPLVDTCTYLISSQCDHEILKSLPPDQTWLWHSSNADPVRETIEELERQHEWYPVRGGTTIATSGLVLLTMLGFRKVEIFGLDSCLRGNDHHAYPQPENDKGHIQKVTIGGKEFSCEPWMLIQANDFQNLVRSVFSKISDFEMVVHGDGLVAQMLNCAAEAVGSE